MPYEALSTVLGLLQVAGYVGIVGGLVMLVACATR